MFNRPLTTDDYIHSMLLDSPDMYIIAPGMQKAYIFVVGVGMVVVQRDFSWMTHNQIETFLFHLKRGIA